jgi:hypothetical protein
MGAKSIAPWAEILTSSGFEPLSGQTKDCICCFSVRKSKDWWARNQNIVSEWSDVSTRRLLFQ